LSDRSTTRARLLEHRERFAASPEVASASASVAQHLARIVLQLEPECLGLYWPMRSEFNAAALRFGDENPMPLQRALPFAWREARRMEYRLWDGSEPALKDECGIASASGTAVVPDVVLVPCVGFTPSGYRLGYGGGYFDRWLAAHPHVTTVGVAWSHAQLGEAEFEVQAHDQPLTLIVTEKGVV
jgi:5-formyltetrahydrofolate cyclo-ligase